MSDIGILGGAFNPPHRGHLALARDACDRFGFARLLVRVIADPGHKTVETPPEARLRLARLAFRDIPGAEVEVDCFARTVDSLEALALVDPVFIVGADEFAAFLDWKRPERVLELAVLGVATRPGYPQHILDEVLTRLSRPERVVFFEIEPLIVSSSAIRRRVAAGESIEGLVTASVAREIERLGLYRDLSNR
jgi:nicotinate-nucleotide adenylyltransferase